MHVMATGHRPRLLGLRSYPDPVTSPKPEVRRVLAGLAALPVADPTPEFRAELRMQLVAVTPRLVIEGEPAAEQPAAPSPTRRTVGSLARIRKPATVLLTVATVFIVLLGGAVFLSGHSLPGDSLYGVKRASEDFQLSLSSSDTDKGKQYLSMAGTRADEVSDLLGQTSALAAGSGPGASGAISAHTAKLVTSTLDTQDSETQSAAELLTASALRTASDSPLAPLLSWAPQQRSKMQAIIALIPSGALHDRAVASENVVEAAETRAQTLAPLVAVPCEATTSADAYGPIPVPGCTSSTPGSPATSGKSTSPQVSTPRAPATSGAPGAPVTLPGVTGVAPSTGGGLPTQLPSQLPSSGPSLPITTGTCGVGVDLPPLISVGVGTCGIGINVGG
jgi:hypothetical protein